MDPFLNIGLAVLVAILAALIVRILSKLLPGMERGLRRLWQTIVPRNHQLQVAPDVVPYRCPLHFRQGATFYDTAFSEVLPEEGLLDHLASEGTHVVVYGVAGSGKSQFAAAALQHFSENFKKGVFAFVHPDQRTPSSSLASQIATQLGCSGNAEIAPELTGLPVFVVVDGLDEMTESERKEVTTSAISVNRESARVLVTCRSPNTVPPDLRTYLEPYTIEQMNESQIVEVVDKWCDAEGASDREKLKKGVISLLASGSLWSPEETLSTPFYLVHSCRFFQESGSLPNDHSDVLEYVLGDLLMKVENPTREVARRLLDTAATLAGREHAARVSVPTLSRDRLLEETDSENPLETDLAAALEELLRVGLLVRHDCQLAFGVHGLVYHYLAAGVIAQKKDFDTKRWFRIDRETLEFLFLRLKKETANQLVAEMLSIVEDAYPISECISIADGNLDPRLPFYAMSRIRGIDMNLVDQAIDQTLDRTKGTDGPTRWLAAEMISALGQHARASKCLPGRVEAIEPYVAADIAEAVTWLGHRRKGWRSWALSELERISRYVDDFHPRLHVLEGIERLELQSEFDEARELLWRLASDENPAVRFSSVSQLAEDFQRWETDAEALLSWIEDKEVNEGEEELPDYILCHGYYALHWLLHPVFGRHPLLEEARDRIRDASERLFWRKSVPFYWIWYLGRPIEDLGLFDELQEHFSAMLADSTVSTDARRFIQSFVVSVNARRTGRTGN